LYLRRQAGLEGVSFLQAGVGIRVFHVTGVQTCALPILLKPLVVHGGGPEINAHLDRLGIESTFPAGLRVTTPEAMEVVRMVLVEIGRASCRDRRKTGVGSVPNWARRKP